jgi:hypothetical protein
MIRVIDIIWVEDKKQYLPSVEDEIKELENEFEVELNITEKNDSDEFKKIAGNVPSSLVFCVDYNLKNEGHGIDGDEVIRNIRSKNKTCEIIFYSAKLNQVELRELIGNDDKFTTCVYRPNLMAKLKDLLDDKII